MSRNARSPVATLTDLLRLRAKHNPVGIPYVFVDDGQDGRSEALTYAQLDHDARVVAATISERASVGDRALLIYRPGLGFNRVFYGCLYAGIIGVPLAVPPLRKGQSGLDRLRAVLANSGARLILTTSDLADRLADAGTLADAQVIATDRLDAAAAEGWRPPRPTGDTVAYLQYSSGSTGAPKGVIITHRNVLANNLVVETSAEISPSTRGVIWLPTFHDMGLLTAVTQPVFSEYTCWTMSPMAFVQRPHRWLQLISDVRGNFSVAPDFAYELTTRRVTDEQAAGLDLSSWDRALCGAEPIRPSVLRAFVERFAPYGMSADALYPCYGLAEATLKVSGGPLRAGMRTILADAESLTQGSYVPTASEETGRTLVSNGPPCEGMTVVIADHETLEPLPTGRIGGIFVAGESVGKGYWGDERATEETFTLRIPGHDGAFMRTGDLGFLQDGHLYITGRQKEVIIVDGANHFPQDLEFTAINCHPAVRPGGCAAFQLVDVDRVELVLVVEVDRRYRLTVESADDDRAIQADHLVEQIRHAIGATHGLRLDTILLVTPRTIPTTTSGKIKRTACREMFALGKFADRIITPEDGNDSVRSNS